MLITFTTKENKLFINRNKTARNSNFQHLFTLYMNESY